MNRELAEAIEQLRKAIEDEGPFPNYHRLMKQRTERGWPTLMAAVERVLAAQEVRDGKH